MTRANLARGVGGPHDHLLSGLCKADLCAKLGLVIAACEGNLRRTADVLGVSDTWTYYLIHKHKLWAVVNAARQAKVHKTRRRALATRLQRGRHKQRWSTDTTD